MVGIIGAMAIEVDNFIAMLDGKSAAEYSGITYVQGTYRGADVVVARCGMGKVNAAICAQTMILMYKPEIVINTGVAGSVSPAVGIGDVVIAVAAVQHDLDLRALGFKKGFIQELDTVLIPCAAGTVAQLENAAKKAGGTYYTGVVATGDQFIGSGEVKTGIFGDFNALACEMEGASIAHVCAVNGVDFGIVRTVSDNADDESPADFNEFLQEAAEKSVKIICEFLGGV